MAPPLSSKSEASGDERRLKAAVGDRRFRLLFERSGDAILLLDGRTLLFVDCNAAALEMLRAGSREEVLSTHPSRLSPEFQPDGRKSFEKANEMIAAAIRQGTHRFEWEHRRMDGTDFPVEVVLTSVQTGEEPLLATVWRDITERKRVEEALRRSESRFRLLFERSTDPILLLDSGTRRFVDCNDAAVKLLGYASKGDLTSTPPWSLSPEFQPDGKRSEEKAAEILEDVRRRGSARFEWMHQSRGGRETPVEIVLTSVEDMGEQPLVVVVWREISERKRAEAAIQELNAGLERRVAERTGALEAANAQLRGAERQLLESLAGEKELSDLKSSFVSMVSHEFRTPLAVILSSAGLLHSHWGKLSAKEREDQVGEIRAATRHMSRLIDEVLVLGRAEAGQMKCVPAELDAETLCLALADECRSATGHVCPVRFTVSGTAAGACGDAALLRHIFSNLLSNAVKYSPPGTPVEFALKREGETAVFTVSDRGIGIPEEDQPRIFGAFQRAGNAGTIPGTGLGLLIVKRCADLHRGDIFLRSRPGEGTVVTVRLPLYAGEDGGGKTDKSENVRKTKTARKAPKSRSS